MKVIKLKKQAWDESTIDEAQESLNEHTEKELLFEDILPDLKNRIDKILTTDMTNVTYGDEVYSVLGQDLVDLQSSAKELSRFVDFMVSRYTNIGFRKEVMDGLNPKN